MSTEQVMLSTTKNCQETAFYVCQEISPLMIANRIPREISAGNSYFFGNFACFLWRLLSQLLFSFCIVPYGTDISPSYALALKKTGSSVHCLLTSVLGPVSNLFLSCSMIGLLR